MLVVELTSQFKRDMKLMLRRGKDLEKFKMVISKLIRGEALEERYRDHALVGMFRYARECHIEPDWLLIYTPAPIFVRLERTGSHADLFR